MPTRRLGAGGAVKNRHPQKKKKRKQLCFYNGWNTTRGRSFFLVFFFSAITAPAVSITAMCPQNKLYICQQDQVLDRPQSHSVPQDTPHTRTHTHTQCQCHAFKNNSIFQMSSLPSSRTAFLCFLCQDNSTLLTLKFLLEIFIRFWQQSSNCFKVWIWSRRNIHLGWLGLKLILVHCS